MDEKKAIESVSEKYVRDHLLIQFMLENFSTMSVGIETAYKEWLTWLRMLRKEENEDGTDEKGSEV